MATVSNRKTTEPYVSEDHLEKQAVVGNYKKIRSRVLIPLLLLIVIIPVSAFIALLYVRNYQVKVAEKEALKLAEAEDEDVFSPDQIIIQEGSIYRLTPQAEYIKLIDKEDYPATGITGFAKVSVSPDNKKLCIEAWPPAPEPGIYMSDVDGSNLALIKTGGSYCIWSPDSKKFFYATYATEDTPGDIYRYMLEDDDSINITNAVDSSPLRTYYIDKLSPDGTRLLCTYATGTGKTLISKNCEIDVATGELIEKDTEETAASPTTTGVSETRRVTPTEEIYLDE